MKDSVMLTTFDNPFNPFKNFDEWFVFDVVNGYNSCAYLARTAETSEILTDEENDRIIEAAIDQIIKYDFRNIYRKIRKSDEIATDVQQEVGGSA